MAKVPFFDRALSGFKRGSEENEDFSEIFSPYLESAFEKGLQMEEKGVFFFLLASLFAVHRDAGWIRALGRDIPTKDLFAHLARWERTPGSFPHFSSCATRKLFLFSSFPFEAELSSLPDYRACLTFSPEPCDEAACCHPPKCAHFSIPWQHPRQHPVISKLALLLLEVFIKEAVETRRLKPLPTFSTSLVGDPKPLLERHSQGSELITSFGIPLVTTLMAFQRPAKQRIRTLFGLERTPAPNSTSTSAQSSQGFNLPTLHPLNPVKGDPLLRALLPPCIEELIEGHTNGTKILHNSERFLIMGTYSKVAQTEGELQEVVDTLERLHPFHRKDPFQGMVSYHFKNKVKASCRFAMTQCLCPHTRELGKNPDEGEAVEVMQRCFPRVKERTAKKKEENPAYTASKALSSYAVLLAGFARWQDEKSNDQK